VTEATRRQRKSDVDADGEPLQLITIWYSTIQWRHL